MEKPILYQEKPIVFIPITSAPVFFFPQQAAEDIMAMVAAMAGSSLCAPSFSASGRRISSLRQQPKFAFIPAAGATVPPSPERTLASAFFSSFASSHSAWTIQQIMHLDVALHQLNSKGLALGVGLGGAASLLCAPQAFAAQEIAQIADGDSRGLILLLVLVPAIAWVLFNILQPALNQIDKMRSSKAVVGGLGIGGAAMLYPHPADAAVQEIASVADSDSRGLLLLVVLLPAIGWVLFNILQPALNQINKMRSKK